MQRYIIQANDGRLMSDIPGGEAKFWAWLSLEFCLYNVYVQGGSTYTVSPGEIK